MSVVGWTSAALVSLVGVFTSVALAGEDERSRLPAGGLFARNHSVLPGAEPQAPPPARPAGARPDHGHYHGYHDDHAWLPLGGHGWCGGIGGIAVTPGYYAPYVPAPIFPVYGYQYWPPVYTPPLLLPSEVIYGPLTLQPFWGLNRPQPLAPLIADDPLADEPDEPKPARGSSPESVARAWKFIGYGDRYFLDQKYIDAYQRYKLAIGTSASLADSYFRQGYALMAMRRYASAVRVIKRGMELDPGWPEAGFRNDQLYGPNRLAKAAHLDALASAAADEPHNADLLFLVGVFLYFDGEAARARPFFERTADLMPGDQAHLRPFLDAPAARKKNEA